MNANTVYTVAFGDDGFLMIYNPRRKGWEMPGGHIEPGEQISEAAKREFVEESGHTVEVVDMTEAHGCFVCAGRLGPKVADGEMDGRVFTELPEELAFDRDEYEGVMEWAYSVMGRYQ